ncbi:MAG: response regulator [Methylomonas sp.]|nr:response regulator [Methylomonas sp.]
MPPRTNAGKSARLDNPSTAFRQTRVWHLWPAPLKPPAFQFADDQQEALFREHWRSETRDALYFGLQMAIVGFLTYVLVDGWLNHRSPPQWLPRSLILPVLLILAFRVRFKSCSDAALKLFIRASCLAAALELTLLSWLDTQPSSLHETWIGLLPLYFFSYGQIWLPVLETTLFGLLSSIAVLSGIQATGGGYAILTTPLLTLLLVNGFGLCLRVHRESHSRQLFLEHLNTERNARDKTRFLQHLSHNLRQPLQAMSCYSAVLDTALAGHSDANLTYLANKLGLAIDELNQTFNHILDIANLETGKQLPHIAAIDINHMLSLLENRFSALANARRLTLRVLLRSQPPYALASDASMLNQIISNLLDNAIKYTRSGWIVVAAVKISPTQLTLCVRDSGIGIADAQQAHIFEPFVRGHRRLDDTCQPGMGLGLAYVAAALEHLPGHSLRFSSTPERGTHFRLYLPIAPSCFVGGADFMDFSDVLRGLLVFIVDDDPNVLDALSQQLRSAGCLVQAAGCVADVKPALDDLLRAPDILISDFFLGNDETAHDVIAIIEAECGTTPVLILSAHAIPAADKARWPKQTHLLRKPASARTLCDAIHQTLAG